MNVPSYNDILLALVAVVEQAPEGSTKNEMMADVAKDAMKVKKGHP